MQGMVSAGSLPAVVLVSAVSFLAYYNSLWGGFVFDDHRAILTNDDLDAEKTDIWGLFVNDFWGGHMSRPESHKSYRPLTVLTYRYLNFWLHRLVPFSYHLVNVLLHCAASVVFLFVCVRLLGARKRWPPVYSALLFSVHSIHTEAVRPIQQHTPFVHSNILHIHIHCYKYLISLDFKCRWQSRSSCVCVLPPLSSLLHESCVKREWRDADCCRTHKMATRVPQCAYE